MCKERPESTEKGAREARSRCCGQNGAREARSGCCGAGCEKRRCVPILAALVIALVAVPMLAKKRKP